MGAVRDICFAISDWLWGVPILFILVGGGIFLTVVTRAFHFVKPGMIWRNTVGNLFDKEKKNGKSTCVSPVHTFFSALGCTVGIGNIVGVGTAIAVGGPGALFWMWICGLFAMTIKYSEVVLSVKYREKQKEGDGYLSGPHMYIKKGLNNNFLAVFFTVLLLFDCTLLCSFLSSSMIEQGSVLGVSPIVILVVTCLAMVFVIFDGLKGLVKIADVIVPLMSVLYILCCVIVVSANITHIGETFNLIFKGAFSGTAAIGGFSGAVFAVVVRQGLSRGVLSNDAGLGVTAMLMAQADGYKHVAEAGSWAIMETFIDTMVICTLTGLAIIISGNWLVADDGSNLARFAFQSVFGNMSNFVFSVSVILFCFTTLTASMHANRVAIENITNSKVWGVIAEVACVVACIFGYFMDVTEALCWADFANVLVLATNVFCMLFLCKDLRAVTDEYFFHHDAKIMAVQKK